MSMRSEITQPVKEYIHREYMLDLLEKHKCSTDEELDKAWQVFKDEWNIYRKFKKECSLMKPYKKIKYLDDYEEELEKLDESSKQPKTITVRTVIKTTFHRWFKNIETRGYKGRHIPFDTFSILLERDKDYLIDGNNIVNLDYLWKDCKYKETTSN